MRAAILRWYGAPPDVGDFEEPQTSDGQEIVEIVAGGLNPVDIRMASGHFYGGPPPLPSAAGRAGIGPPGDGSLVYFVHAVTPVGPVAARPPIVIARPIPPDGQAAPPPPASFGMT